METVSPHGSPRAAATASTSRARTTRTSCLRAARTSAAPPGAPGPNTNMRGIPDIAYQASARTGVLVYLTEPDTTSSGVGCGGANPCSTGWYVVGGTSASSPQWAGLIAMADQIANRDLGFINPALYALANNPATYAADFYDVSQGNNGCCGEPGYDASRGWDA